MAQPVTYATNKKEVIFFQKTIPAGTTDVLAERIKAPATIEGIKVRFYKGQQLALQVQPFVEHKGNRVENLVTYPSTTKQFLTGEDDNFDIPVVVSADYDDFIKIRVTNTDSVNNYDLSIQVTVDYMGGMARMV